MALDAQRAQFVVEPRDPLRVTYATPAQLLSQRAPVLDLLEHRRRCGLSGTPWRAIGDRSAAPRASVSVESDTPRPAAMQGIVRMVDLRPERVDFGGCGFAPAVDAECAGGVQIGHHQFMPPVVDRGEMRLSSISWMQDLRRLISERTSFGDHSSIGLYGIMAQTPQANLHTTRPLNNRGGVRRASFAGVAGAVA